MEIINGLENIDKKFKNPAMTIGNFDGVHFGHQRIFSLVKESSVHRGGHSIVTTFDPHPLEVLTPGHKVPLLTSFVQKAKLIEQKNIDFLICIKFTPDFANTDPDVFIKDVLVDTIGAKHIVVGENFRFGKEKKGTPELLEKRGHMYGFQFDLVKSIKKNGQVISSSSIRKLILHGEIKKANSFLNHPHSISGVVVKGKGRGRALLNIPTANLTTPFELAPRPGVYAVFVNVDDSIYKGVANIGMNPTFGAKNLNYEVHLLDFDENLLEKNIQVFFIDRIRQERTFKSPEELKKQILFDIERGVNILDEHKGLYINVQTNETV